MRVNPIVFYEVLLNSTIDKVYEYNDTVIFYNIVIPGGMENPEEHIIIKIIKKGHVAILLINDTDYEEFPFEDQLKEKFNFVEKSEYERFSQISDRKDSVRETFTGRKDSEAIIGRQE